MISALLARLFRSQSPPVISVTADAAYIHVNIQVAIRTVFVNADGQERLLQAGDTLELKFRKG